MGAPLAPLGTGQKRKTGFAVALATALPASSAGVPPHGSPAPAVRRFNLLDADLVPWFHAPCVMRLHSLQVRGQLNQDGTAAQGIKVKRPSVHKPAQASRSS